MAEPSELPHANIERHVQRLDGEVLLIKSTLSAFGAELHSLKSDMAKGFDAQAVALEKQSIAMFAALKEQANAKPRFGMDNLLSVLSIGAMFCTVFWLVINQRIDPLKEKIEDGFRRADHESLVRHEAQQIQIDTGKLDIKKLEDRQLQLLMSQSADQARHDALARICEENHEAIKKLNTP